jgi:hypothetical protein
MPTRLRWERGLFRAYLVWSIMFALVLLIPYVHAGIRYHRGEGFRNGLYVGSYEGEMEEVTFPEGYYGFMCDSLLYLGGPHYVRKTIIVACLGILPWILHPVIKWGL